MTTTLDREVLDLIADDPELLAIADAVASTQKQARRRTLPIGAAAAVVAAAIAVALFAPWQGSGAPVVARALAAIGNGPVVHLIVREAPAVQPGVRPGTSERQWELWYDRRHHLLHVVERDGARVLSDVIETPRGTITATRVIPPRGLPRLAPVLADFATRYRDDLAAGRVDVLGRADVAGTSVLWLRSGSLHVAVDAQSYEPVYLRHGTAGPLEQIVAAETLPLGSGDFRAPRRARH